MAIRPLKTIGAFSVHSDAECNIATPANAANPVATQATASCVVLWITMDAPFSLVQRVFPITQEVVDRGIIVQGEKEGDGMTGFTIRKAGIRVFRR